jgi:hypothetical protein
MPQLQTSFSTIFRLFSAMSPLFLTFLLLMISLFNQDLKGLVFLVGVSFAMIINVFLMPLFNSRRQLAVETMTCDLFSFNVESYNSPAPTSLFMAFTIIYLFLPMLNNNLINYPVIISLLGLFVIDAATKMDNNCTDFAGIIFGGIFGSFLGGLYYAIIHVAGGDSLLYFDELMSNRVLCSKPSKQTFKCSVYKGGKIISTNIA